MLAYHHVLQTSFSKRCDYEIEKRFGRKISKLLPNNRKNHVTGHTLVSTSYLTASFSSLPSALSSLLFSLLPPLLFLLLLLIFYWKSLAHLSSIVHDYFGHTKTELNREVIWPGNLKYLLLDP